MQIGENEISIHLSEQSKFLNNVYDAFKGSALTEFRFFDDTLVQQAVYLITLVVGDTCKKGEVADPDIELSGNL